MTPPRYFIRDIKQHFQRQTIGHTSRGNLMPCGWLLLIFLFGMVGLAKGQETTISGTVIDPSGAAITTAHVRLQQPGGILFTTQTNGAGTFQFPSLTASDYVIEISADGFEPYKRQVTLLVGQVLSVNATLRVSSSTSVTVNSNTAVVNETSSEVAGNIDVEAMKTLPLNGRNWMNLSMLVPGIRVNAIGNFTPLGTTVSGKFQLNLDGQQVTQDTADPKYGQPQFSRDAIAQFEVITNRFDATLGRSSQIYVNAQTKTGQDTLHGSAFSYFRNSALNAADPIAKKVLPFSDQQYGGSFGGPIRKQRLWYFGSYEGERQPNTIISNPLGFSYQYSHPSLLNTGEYLLRSDYMINSNNYLFVRGNGYTWNNPYNLASGTTDPSQLYATTRTNYGYLVNWSSTHGAGMVNDLKASFNHFQWTNTEYVSSMTLNFPTTTIGGSSNYPQIFNQDTQQYRDDLYYLAGKHSIKLGAEDLFTHYGGIYENLIRGAASCSKDPASFPAVFPNTSDPTTWNLAAIDPLCTTFTQGFGNFNMNVPENAIGLWVQDDWRVAKRITLNLGLRYDNDIGAFNSGQSSYNGLQVKKGGDNHEFGPRIGFAIDPTGSGTTVIRGGAGIYFADIAANQIINQQLFNGVTTVQASVSQTATTNINLANPFGPTTPAEILANPSHYVQSPQINAPNVETPFSVQASLGAQRQLSSSWSMTVDGVFTRVYHDWSIIDANLFYDPTTGYNMNPVTAGRPLPQFTAIQESITPSANGSIYEGLQVGIKKRLSNGLAAGVAYTLSDYRDTDSGPFNYPNNPFNLAAEWATSKDDQRNTLSANGDYYWKWGLQGGLLYHFGSGNAYGTTVGGASPTGLGSYVTNRTFSSTPVRYEGSFGSETCAQATGFACTYVYNNPKHNYLDPRSGFYITSRDAFRGAPFERLDAHLQKSFKLGERYNVTVITEAFNVFNHSNYGAYNTTVTSSGFGTPASVTGNPPDYGARQLQLAARLDF